MGAGVRIEAAQAARSADRLVGRRRDAGAGAADLPEPGGGADLCDARRDRRARRPGRPAQAQAPILRGQFQVVPPAVIPAKAGMTVSSWNDISGASLLPGAAAS